MSFLKLLAVHDTTAAGLFKAIEDFFNKHEIDIKRCMMFTSVGAEVMLGKWNGVQAKIKVKESECMGESYNWRCISSLNLFKLNTVIFLK